MDKHRSRTASQRQLKVGEEIRHALSEIFLLGRIAELVDISVTVSEVRVSPDLRNVTAYILFLGKKQEESVESLAKVNELSPKVRYLLARMITLKYSPNILFKYDDTFDQALHMEALFSDIAVDSTAPAGEV